MTVWSEDKRCIVHPSTRKTKICHRDGRPRFIYIEMSPIRILRMGWNQDGVQCDIRIATLASSSDIVFNAGSEGEVWQNRIRQGKMQVYRHITIENKVCTHFGGVRVIDMSDERVREICDERKLPSLGEYVFVVEGLFTYGISY